FLLRGVGLLAAGQAARLDSVSPAAIAGLARARPARRSDARCRPHRVLALALHLFPESLWQARERHVARRLVFAPAGGLAGERTADRLDTWCLPALAAAVADAHRLV